MLSKRIYNFYKQYGLKLLVVRAFQKVVLAYIRFINNMILTRKLPRQEKSIIKDVNGYKMRLDVNMDKGLCKFLAIADVREAYILEALKGELNEGDIVVDIGANVGYYALLEAKMIGDKGKVYAIEPIADTIELLKENIRLNGYTNIDIYNHAIGDKTGVSTMYVSEWRNRSQMKDLGNMTKMISREVEVPVSTLDDFLEDKECPDLIRMDVEGYEYNIIKGMEKTLEKKLPLKICVEVHFRWLGRDKSMGFLRTLKNAGFEITAATYEVDEQCITKSKWLGDLAAYLNSAFYDLPPKGHIDICIDDILHNKIIWGDKEGAWDLCMRLGTLEILFKR